MQKVVALTIGEIEHETAKAVKVSGRWFPKAAIEFIAKSTNGDDVIVFRRWFVAKNPWLVKDELGIAISIAVTLIDGRVVFQGYANKFKSY